VSYLSEPAVSFRTLWDAVDHHRVVMLGAIALQHRQETAAVEPFAPAFSDNVTG
jgi:hypothetical protein